MNLYRDLREAWLRFQRELRRDAARREIRGRFPSLDLEGDAFADAGCEFAENVVVANNAQLTGCQVGRYTYFAHDAEFCRCRVGAFCSIGPYALAGLGRHPAERFVSTHPTFFSERPTCRQAYVSRQRFAETAPIEIGNDVWIGARAILLDGVKIGHGAIIGAGAVVTHDVEPYAIVTGAPARVVRKRFPDEDIAFLLSLAWWDKDLEWIRKHGEFFDDVARLKAAIS